MTTDKKTAVEDQKPETESSKESEKVHVFEKMIDFTYIATTKIPIGGKYAKDVLDDLKVKERAKKVSHKYFEPLFPVPRLKKRS